MLEGVDKHALVAAFRARLKDDLATLARRQADTQAGATHAENRAEHAKDTRATEESYLARGLADRVADVRRNVEAVSNLEVRAFGENDVVTVGALVYVALEDEEEEVLERWLVLPGAAGIELEADGVLVRSVTPISPLGQALLGLEVGDEGTYKTPSGARTFEVVELA